jgi:RNA polymerase sigma factor for flagellar operon FliA
MNAQVAHNPLEARVRQLTPTVKKIARHMMAALPPSVEMDDLVQFGMIGLLEAAQPYHCSDGVEFETYASHRIRGAMLDGLREADWLPRKVRRRMREVEAMISRLEQQNGKAPSELELAQALDMSLADYQQLLLEARGYQILSYEDLSPAEGDSFLERHAADHDADPLAIIEGRGLRDALVKGIDKLPEREKTVVALYYQEDLRQREIGEILGISESRVCQILTQAVARLRVTLQQSVSC